MRKSAVLLLAVIAGVGCWFFFQKFQVIGLEHVKVVPRDPSAVVASGASGAPATHTASELPVRRQGDRVRIASFNIQVLGRSKLAKPHVMDVLARIVRQFDVVAIQEIRSVDQDVLPRFIDLINASGRKYDYIIGPRLGRSDSKEQYAFIFDMESLEVDRTQIYTVDDPDDLMHREPLVAWFRVRGPAENEAFTFTLVNIHTDPDETDQELNVLDDVFRAVQNDGRGEDDVLLIGDLNVDDSHLGELGRIPEISWVISHLPTNTRGSAQYDNIVYHRRATSEFTGRGGVFDFMREYNLSLEEALEISDHLPVWAEFNVLEGGEPGRVAKLPKPLVTEN